LSPIQYGLFFHVYDRKRLDAASDRADAMVNGAPQQVYARGFRDGQCNQWDCETSEDSTNTRKMQINNDEMMSIIL
jgi:hypothetical protein